MKRIILLICVLCLFTVSVSASDSEQVIYRYKENDRMEIALTFDDGPHPYYTGKILDILDEYGIKATFFFVGQNVEYYSDAAEKVMAAGHEIGNHTYTHHCVRALGHDELIKELGRCEDAIFELDEYRPRVFRPPEGAFNDDVEKTAQSLGYSVILWSIDTRDWDHQSPDNIMKNVMTNVKSGDIILMHDYIGHNSPTPDALRMIIPALIERGYHFVTVSELISD